jgi:hypothetical protein
MALLKNMVNSTEFLSGGGEVSALIRTINWGQTPVGSPDSWPTSLKNTIRLILDNGSPMYVIWGKEYTQFYNDAFRSMLKSDRPPVVMGFGARETFTGAWKTLEPILEEVMEGRTVFVEDHLLPLFRNGSLEDCYFSLSFSPIRAISPVLWPFFMMLLSR